MSAYDVLQDTAMQYVHLALILLNISNILYEWNHTRKITYQ
jgi:hypothetical protein